MNRSPEILGSSARHTKSRRIVLTCEECLRRKQKCDRLKPCSNCIARQVENRCIYNDLPRKLQKNSQSTSTVDPADNGSHATIIVGPTTTEGLDISSFGYSRTNAHSTLSSLVNLQSQFKDLNLFPDTVESDAGLTLKSRYMSLVSQLPDKSYTKSLVTLFFDNVNDWQYSILDRYFFQTQLENWWNCIPDMILVGHQKGTRSNDDKYFPALLFQVVALSLQFLPPTAAIDLEFLKKGKSLHALSAKYSDLGCTLMALLGRHFPTISSVQHDLLRSAWLKTSDLIPESWHTLSQAIRQAQEIGLYEDKKGNEGPDSVADKLCQIWHDEYGKRLWLNLFIWDIQMAMMLGRPTTIDTNACKFTPPMNCSMPENLSETVPELLKEGDAPSPFTERLLQYQLTLQILKMTAMGANRPFPRDPSIISTLHQEALSFLNSIPATLRHQNPDTRWDTECSFLLHQREFLLCGTLFYLLALHRPHSSTISKSRDAALQAAFMILESQQRLFKHVSPQYYKLHSITFFNFDASVQLSAILLSQPAPEALTVERALRCIGLSINLLEAVAEQSPLAKAGLPVVQALYQRLQASLHVDHEEVSPLLPKLPLDIVLTPRADTMSSGVSDNTIIDSLWTFDHHSAQLSLNFGSSWDSFGGEEYNSRTLPLDSMADHATLPYLPGQGVSANGFVNDSSGTDLLAQMDVSTDEHFPHWYID